MSDPDRPELAGRAAFEELESVVRNVTEQLTGYRRRALSSEAQLRDLEPVAARAAIDAEAARAAQARVTELERALLLAEQAVADATASATAAERAGEAAAEAAARHLLESASQEPANAEVLAENAALRERLAEASTRTRQIAERVRFMRQQLSNGADK